MKTLYAETVSTCHKCGKDIEGKYWEIPEGIQLETFCPTHGPDSELVEKDAPFFKRGYEYDGYSAVKHLILPVTYRCNLSCKYCYAHSNYKHDLPVDRSIETLVEIVKKAECPTVNLAGGEPTVREDLPELLKRLKKEAKVKRLCVVTNGQNTIHLDYMKTLHESGMDFLFLPLFIAGYKPSGRVINNIIRSLDNAYQLRIPVWIQAAVENTSQIEHVLDILRKYRKIIFNITIRSVRPYGVTSPDQVVHVSDIIRFLGHENDYTFGNHPFNRYINLFGRKAKISSWVNDRLKLDKYDAEYVIHDDSILPFHKGMILDDIHFKSHKDHC